MAPKATAKAAEIVDDALRPIAQDLLRGLEAALSDLPPAVYEGLGWEKGPGNAGRFGWVKRRAALADALDMIARALRDAYEAGVKDAPRANAEQYGSLLDAAHEVLWGAMGGRMLASSEAKQTIHEQWCDRERERAAPRRAALTPPPRIITGEEARRTP